MGVRIDAHAVDVVTLGRVLERPLWRILLDVLAEHADDEAGDVLFNVFNPSSRERYHVLGRRGITCSRLGYETETVPENHLRHEPFLQQSTLQHFADPQTSSLMLMFLLRELTHVDGQRYVVPITSRHRRWWVQSTIEAVRRDRLLDAGEAEELAGFLGRILRSYRAADGAPHRPERPTTYDVPGISVDDSDNRFAVFNETEARRLGAVIERIIAAAPDFPVPITWADDPETVVTWTGWVTDRLVEFARLRELQLPNLRLVTFIG